MLPILTPAESADLDRRSAERGVTTLQLMERAGWEVARAVARLVAAPYGRRAVVLCGKGNNGGDGLVAARYLERAGMGVSVVLMVPPDDLRGAAAHNFRRFHQAGGRWRVFSPETLARELARADVAVDALFGTGFRGVPEDGAAAAIRALNASSLPVVAVDIPSGVEGESGAVRGEAVQADVTVTFGALKPGVVFYPGAAYAGRVQVVDIGFPPDLVRSDLWLVEREDAAALVEPRDPEAHKRSVGVVVVLAGSRTMTGAAALTARGAYRAGAGLVTLAVPSGILPVVQGAVAEATFLPLPETGEGGAAEEGAPLLLERLGEADALAMGPGLSRDPSTQALVRRLVADSPVPVVLDADGLNAFAGRGAELADRASELLITPHAGEFGRLTGLSTAQVLEDRVGHARKAAAEFRCAVLLKGPRTLVAEPGGTVRVNPTGGPFLASGGTGDVLTGAVAAFLARGLSAADAGVLAAYVHGQAGRMAAEELGEQGVTASDVAARLPAALDALLEP
ncbi:MAG TPA: NAD(P)H-hydrate dehydratase [Actinomycetota bacterium]|nr:NAD(P)H-hydrate dehydratase [Actinomycetota bacterium]